MFEFIKNIFKADPRKKLLKQRDRLYVEAVNLQRSGDLRSYGEVMKRIQDIEDECLSLSEGGDA